MSLIVIDGLDGSGKATQAEIICTLLLKSGKPVRKITFPNYSSDSSAPLRMYLEGKLGEDPDSVNAYAASSFFAVDRYISYKTEWGKDYESGSLILCDRYSTSNAIHQMTKLDKREWDGYLRWYDDYEHTKMEIPRPTLVLYLDMDPSVSKRLLSERYMGNETKRDIHEKDFEYLLHCRTAALYAAQSLGWKVIKCSDDNNPYPINAITNKIMDEIRKVEHIDD